MVIAAKNYRKIGVLFFYVHFVISFQCEISIKIFYLHAYY